MAGSSLFRGEVGQVEIIEEYKVEMVVMDALKSAHPYEGPAYHVIKMEVF